MATKSGPGGPVLAAKGGAMSMQHAQYVLLRELLVLVVNSNSFTPSLRHLFLWGFSNSCVSSQVHFWLPRVSAKSGSGGHFWLPIVDLGGHFWLPKVDLG